MQRPSTYGHSPPLHHPVPQHVSSVPQLRSPPPPQPPSQPSYGGNPYASSGMHHAQQQHHQHQHQHHPGQQQGQSHNVFGAYGNFINDPSTQVAAQFGQAAFKHGQDYVEQNFSRFFHVSALKYYFNVSNSYVVNKLFLVLFPWRHHPWSRKQLPHPSAGPGQDGPGYAYAYAPPREDVNSPDMYIPVMALVTYILLATLLAGLRGQFRPELLASTATWALGVVGFEIGSLKLGTYILGISSQSQLLDLIAYSGYKFVGIIVTIAVAEVANGGKGTGGWIGWLVFVYTVLANALFLMRSLRYVLLPESPRSTVTGPMQTGGPVQLDSRAKRMQRTNFLFAYSYVVQAFFMWLLSRA